MVTTDSINHKRPREEEKEVTANVTNVNVNISETEIGDDCEFEDTEIKNYEEATVEQVEKRLKFLGEHLYNGIIGQVPGRQPRGPDEEKEIVMYCTRLKKEMLIKELKKIIEGWESKHS